MKTIPSFQIDHNILKKGIYISRIDDDITTYDIRMRKPNREPVMTNAAMHTIEHLFATYVRNTEFGDNIIYFGPMGCRTGFYFLTRSLSDNYSINLIKEAFQFIADYWGVIPGASPKECGNCLDHNLPQAKEEAKAFLEIIKDWTKEELNEQNVKVIATGGLATLIAKSSSTIDIVDPMLTLKGLLILYEKNKNEGGRK